MVIEFLIPIHCTILTSGKQLKLKYKIVLFTGDQALRPKGVYLISNSFKLKNNLSLVNGNT